MNRDKQNQEGYDDPTAYEAITNIEQEERALQVFRPIVYICSPYSGDLERNTRAARNYSRYAVDKGYIPLALAVPAVSAGGQAQGTAVGSALWQRADEQMR